MNKKLHSAAVLLCLALGATAQDLTITIPKTDYISVVRQTLSNEDGMSVRCVKN